jgi:hypothetical protein
LITADTSVRCNVRSDPVQGITKIAGATHLAPMLLPFLLRDAYFFSDAKHTSKWLPSKMASKTSKAIHY